MGKWAELSAELDKNAEYYCANEGYGPNARTIGTPYIDGDVADKLYIIQRIDTYEGVSENLKAYLKFNTALIDLEDHIYNNNDSDRYEYLIDSIDLVLDK